LTPRAIDQNLQMKLQNNTVKGFSKC